MKLLQIFRELGGLKSHCKDLSSEGISVTLPKPSLRGQETAEATASITAATGYWVASLLRETGTSAETARQLPQLVAKELRWLPLPSRSLAGTVLWQNRNCIWTLAKK